MITNPHGDKINNYNSNPHLFKMGWSQHFQAQLETVGQDGWIPARVAGVGKNTFQVSNGKSEWLATVAGRIGHGVDGTFPVTGDWVLVTDSMIVKVLARQNALSRGAAGTRSRQDAQPRKEQIIAANLDTVFIVCGLDRDFNLRRIERYLTLVYNCGLNPVIILTKADLHRNPDAFVGDVESVAFGVPVHLVSALDDAGLTALAPYLAPGQTATMVGSSGAGKSTLVNRLCGRDVQATASVSAHGGKGRHTTTTRDLIVMPQGGMVIDNPGIREIAFWDTGEGVGNAFPEIEELAGACRFSDCSHTHEPGCRVLQAVAEGRVSPGRLESYQKLKRELAYLSDRQSKSADRVEKERWKDVAVKIKAMNKERRKR